MAGIVSFFHGIGITISVWFLSLVKIILNLIFDLANISFFSDDVIGSILTRVYIIVGVLMLFKITISCIQYLVSPDKAEDKENGFGGIIKRALISIALLALVPSIFNFAKSAQNAILEALPKVILGQENTSNVDEISESIAYTTALSFINYSSENCNDGSIGGLAGASSNPTFSKIADILEKANVIASAKCGGKNRYTFSYLCLPAGIFLIFILVSMVIDVGIRVVKFGFLEMIAPIPIASYIDPKTSKKSFDSWVHNSLTVYADLFIRLGVIYLVLHLFMILLPSFSVSFKLNDGTTLSWARSMLVNVAIIISLFFFAKNAPKFICEVLGIKPDGNIGDMFKRAGGLAGMPLAFGRDSYANYRNKMNELKARNGGIIPKGAKGKALKQALKSGGASLRASGVSVMQGKGFKAGMSSAKSAAAKSYGLNKDLKDNGVSRAQYYGQVLKNKMGINTVVDATNTEINAGKAASDSARAALDYVHVNAAAKFTNVRFGEAYMSDTVKGKLATLLPDELVIGLDANGREMKINKSDLITTYRKDANGKFVLDSNGKPIVEQAAKYSIAEVQGMLNNVLNDTSGRYDSPKASVYKTQANGLLDALSGIGDMYIVNNSKNGDSGVANNPAFNNSIQEAISKFMENSGNTVFGRDVMAYAAKEDKKKGKEVWTDGNGGILPEHLGDFLSYVKGLGQTIQEHGKATVGKQGAELVAKGIADKYDKKGGN